MSTILATPEFWRLHVFGTDGWAEIRNERTLTTRFAKGKSKTVEYPDNDSVQEALLSFADAVEARGTYPLTDLEAVNGAAVLEALNASAASGAPVGIA